MNTKKYSNSFAAWCWLLLSAVIIVIVAFCHFPDGADWKWCIPLEGRYHIPMMLGGIVFVGLLSLLVTKCCRSDKVHRGRLWIVTAVLTCIQILLVYSYYVHTDWDVQQVTGLAQSMAEGRSIEEFESYFRWNPNNLLLSRIFALVFFVTGPMLGLKTTLFPLIMLQCLGCGLTALMLFQTAMHIWRRKVYAMMVYVLYILMIGLSPWWSIPYSDIWGLMLSVLLLWMATAAPFKRQWVRIFVFAAVSALGYYIKPQTLFVGFAIVIVQLFDMLRHLDSIKNLLRPTATALGGIVAGVLLAHLAVAGSGLHLHTSKGFDAPHYLMMGANYQSIGIYSAQDVDFSRSYPKKKERHKAEIEETIKRYKALGPDGTLILWGRKNLLNFSDGTFYWGREGAFYKYVPERDGWLSRLTRNVYYNRGVKGRWNDAWTTCATSLWFGIMIFAMLAALPKKRKAESGERKTGSKGQTMDIIFWSLLLLTLFHTLCEARARYLFCFAPIFILAAVEGIRRIIPMQNNEN